MVMTNSLSVRSSSFFALMSVPNSLKVCFVGDCADLCNSIWCRLSGGRPCHSRFLGYAHHVADDFMVLGLWVVTQLSL